MRISQKTAGIAGIIAGQRVFCLLLLSLFLLLLGCASSKRASYHYTNKQIEHGDINFHRSIRVDEYLNAFPQDEIPAPVNGALTLQVAPFTSRQPAGEDRALIQVAVKSRKALASETQAAVGLVLVLDVSGSMDSDGKIDDMVKAVAEAAAELNDGDEIAIVVFNNEARTIVPAQTIEGQSRKAIIETLEQLIAGGGTSIQAGLVRGYRELSRFQGKGPRRLLLITDGRSTVDVLSPAEIAGEAGVEYREGSRISTVGLGYDVDDGLLREIARQGRGHYYFAENSKALRTLLMEELDSVVVPVVKDASLRITASEGFDLLNVYGAESARITGNSVTIDINELNVDDWRIIVAEVAGGVGQGDHQPIKAELSYIEVQTGEGGSLSASASVSWHNGDSRSNGALNAAVARNSVLYGNAVALMKAGQLSEEEKYREALEIIDLQLNNNRALADLDSSGSMEKEITRLVRVRNILASRGLAQDPPPVEPRLVEPEPGPSRARSIVAEGLRLSATVLPGIWSTVARLLAAAIE